MIAMSWLAACGAPMQTLELVNQTPRQIEAFYVYPHGADRGASRGQLAPNAHTSVQVKAGRIDVYAVSAKSPCADLLLPIDVAA
jgi:hypothetical protein